MTEKEAIKRVEEFGLHHAIGDLPNSAFTVKAFEMAVKALEEIQQYRAIGTVEECRKAMEKQEPGKPKFEVNLNDCTSRFVCECGKRIIVKHDCGVMDNHDAPKYCCNCGRKFDWNR